MKRKPLKRSHHLFAIWGSIVCGVLILTGIALFLVNRRLCFVDYIQYDYTESADAIQNPYIGWYTIRGYLLAEDATFSLPAASTATNSSNAINSTSSDQTASDSSDLKETSAPGLSLIEINLKNYANCDLTDTALTEIDSILSAWAQTGSQLILRFLYDWDGQNLQSEPKELAQILTHMEQVGPIVNEYASSVYLLQGIFVGNWGEMNNTAHMGNGEMETLIQKLAEVTDPSIFLSVRTPAQWRTIVGEGGRGLFDRGQFNRGQTYTSDPVASRSADEALLVSRLGLYNDGMLGSANDTGTYGDKVAADADTNYSNAWTREDELTFQNDLCRSVPNGGEVIIDNPYNDFDNAIKDLAQMHVSYLNSAYDSAVLDKWKATIVTGNSDIWNGMSGYDYIERHLGYRYVLNNGSNDSSNNSSLSNSSSSSNSSNSAGSSNSSSSLLKFHPLFDETGTLTVAVKNVGFSNCYRPLEVMVSIVSDRTGECVASVAADTDPRNWNSGETTEFEVPIDVRSLTNMNADNRTTNTDNNNDTDNNDINDDTDNNDTKNTDDRKEDTYTIYLKCTDPALDRTILFANTQPLTEYGYELGRMAISKGFQ